MDYFLIISWVQALAKSGRNCILVSATAYQYYYHVGYLPLTKRKWKLFLEYKWNMLSKFSPLDNFRKYSWCQNFLHLLWILRARKLEILNQSRLNTDLTWNQFYLQHSHFGKEVFVVRTFQMGLFVSLTILGGTWMTWDQAPFCFSW